MFLSFFLVILAASNVCAFPDGLRALATNDKDENGDGDSTSIQAVTFSHDKNGSAIYDGNIIKWVPNSAIPPGIKGTLIVVSGEQNDLKQMVSMSVDISQGSAVLGADVLDLLKHGETYAFKIDVSNYGSAYSAETVYDGPTGDKVKDDNPDSVVPVNSTEGAPTNASEGGKQTDVPTALNTKYNAVKTSPDSKRVFKNNKTHSSGSQISSRYSWIFVAILVSTIVLN